MEGLTLAVGSAVGYFGGVVAHEVTHWATARLLGREAHIDWFGMDTRFDVDDIDRWKHRAILMAPQAVGGAAAVGGLLAGVQLSIGAIPLLLAWTAYTLLGGPADWSLRVSQGEPARDVLADLLGMTELTADHQQQILHTFAGFAVVAAGYLIMEQTTGSTAAIAKIGYWLGGLPVLALGMGLLLAGLIGRESHAI